MHKKFDFNKLKPIAQLIEQVENKTISLSSYYSHLLSKTNQFNPILNTYISFNEKVILEKLQKYQEKKQDDQSRKQILRGIPFNIKDCFISKDYPTTFGVKEGTQYTKDKNSNIITIFEKEGAILFGKTSIPAYAYDVQTFNEVVGITNNPWNEKYSSGGSTGGGAVSVATGMIPIAIGSDFAGSIRIPAHFCGVKGYIPSNGFQYLSGHYPDVYLDQDYKFIVGQIGFLSNFVFDFTRIHKVLHKGIQKINDFVIHDYNILVSFQDEYIPISEEYKDHIQNVIDVLKINQLESTVKFPNEFSFKNMGSLHAKLMNISFDKEKNKDYSGIEELKEQKGEYINRMDKFLHKRFWILPVSSTPAIKHNLEHKPIVVDGKSIPYWRAMIHYTRPFNILTNPSITLPIGKNREGLPIGIQILAETGNDLGLLRFAEFLESNLGSIGFPPGYEIN